MSMRRSVCDGIAPPTYRCAAKIRTSLPSWYPSRSPAVSPELEIFGATHAGLAAYLFGLWGLPAAIVEAVAFHHTPEKSELKKFSALPAVHVANALAEESPAGSLNLDYLHQIGLAHRLDDWQDTAAELQTVQFA